MRKACGSKLPHDDSAFSGKGSHQFPAVAKFPHAKGELEDVEAQGGIASRSHRPKGAVLGGGATPS